MAAMSGIIISSSINTIITNPHVVGYSSLKMAIPSTQSPLTTPSYLLMGAAPSNSELKMLTMNPLIK
jgi:hypothetical protein